MPFKPGESGNPNGRPKGSLNKHTKLRELLESRGDELVNKAIDMALEGDSSTMKACLERLVPGYRLTNRSLSIPGIEGTPTEKALAVLDAMVSGELTIDDTNNALNAIAQSAKIRELDDLEQRITRLEQQKG